MKKTLLSLLILFALASSLRAQNLELTIGGGAFNIPNQKHFPRPHIGSNINFGMHYNLSEMWIIGTNYNLGHMGYLNPPLENIYNPYNHDLSYSQEGRVQQENFSILIIRKIPLPWWKLRLEAGSGAGMMLQKNSFHIPWTMHNPDKPGIVSKIHRTRDFNLPLHFALKKDIHQKVLIGVSAGQFINQRLEGSGSFYGLSFGYIL